MKSGFSSGGFCCLHCRAEVLGDIRRSGVRNRNHCPYCLWSRHLDWQSPGDRLSSCKGAMPPIGLTLKRIRKKYGDARSGELMVIHRCSECRRLSINRIAADDATDALVDVFRLSLDGDDQIRVDAEAQGIQILNRADWELISRRLFGEARPVDEAAD